METLVLFKRIYRKVFSRRRRRKHVLRQGRVVMVEVNEVVAVNQSRTQGELGKLETTGAV